MPKPGYLELKGKKYQVITLDFETYYDKEYTLNGKINTSEYIRDDRFHAHGVGLKIGDKKAQWYTGQNIRKALEQVDWSRSAMLGHNVAFDGFICSHVYGVKPALYLDTLSMARAAHGHHMRHNLDTLAKVHGLEGKVKGQALVDTKGKIQLTLAEERALGAYCLDDVNDTYKIFWDLLSFIPDPELRLIDITIKMFCDPVLLVDIPRVQRELERELGAKAAALLITGLEPSKLISNKMFAAELEKLGVRPPLKVSPSTGNLTFAFAKTDTDFQDLLNHPDERVADLAKARKLLKSSIGETRAVRFLEAGKDGMPLPVMLNYSQAHTHRWSGGNKMNLQNLLRGGELRRSIIAPKGMAIVVSDSAQIEARVTAWLARQMDLVKAFRDGEDTYKMMASPIYNVPVSEVTEDQRFVGKVCVLGLGFGMGANRLQVTLKQGLMGTAVDMPLDECKRVVNLYRSTYPMIPRLWKAMDDVILSMFTGTNGALGPIEYGNRFIRLPNGLFLQYPGLRGDIDEYNGRYVLNNAEYLTVKGHAKLYGASLTENVVQALARCVIGEQMLAIDDLGYRIVTMTHDEIVVLTEKKKADKCLKDMLHIMATPPEWAKGLPLAAKGGWDINYSK